MHTDDLGTISASLHKATIARISTLVPLKRSEIRALFSNPTLRSLPRVSVAFLLERHLILSVRKRCTESVHALTLFRLILNSAGDSLRKFVYHQRNIAAAIENTAKVMQTEVTTFLESSADAKKEELSVR